MSTQCHVLERAHGLHVNVAHEKRAFLLTQIVYNVSFHYHGAAQEMSLVFQ